MRGGRCYSGDICGHTFSKGALVPTAFSSLMTPPTPSLFPLHLPHFHFLPLTPFPLSRSLYTSPFYFLPFKPRHFCSLPSFSTFIVFHLLPPLSHSFYTSPLLFSSFYTPLLFLLPLHFPTSFCSPNEGIVSVFFSPPFFPNLSSFSFIHCGVWP